MQAIDIDIIIISNARSAEHHALTCRTIETLLASEREDAIHFHVFVVESASDCPDYEYPRTHTLRPGKIPFGYHTYLNLGVRAGSSAYIGLANNDLEFYPGWASAILKAMAESPEIQSAGTWCQRFHGSRNIPSTPMVQRGYTNGIHITGWFLFLTRKSYHQMGGLDEHFSFWYCDDDYGQTLRSLGIVHALITSARVDHITSQSTIRLTPEEFRKLTLIPNLYFDYKWNHRSYPVYLIKRLILAIKLKWNLTR